MGSTERGRQPAAALGDTRSTFSQIVFLDLVDLLAFQFMLAVCQKPSVTWRVPSLTAGYSTAASLLDESTSY